MSITRIAGSSSTTDQYSPGHHYSWRRLVRVALIQHRATFMTVLFTTAALVIAIIIGRMAVIGDYGKYLAAGCTLAHPTNLQVCAHTTNKFADIPSFTPLVIALRIFPLVIGAFVGAPLIARELELGTYRFSWTQGVGRARQLLVMLAILAAILTFAAVVLGFLFESWYMHPYSVINVGVGSQWQSGLFMTTWWMTPVLSVFELLLGTLIGALVKRTVAAIATTAFIGGAIIVGMSQLIPRILDIGASASSRILLSYLPLGTVNTVATEGVGPSGSFLVKGWLVGPGGHVLGDHAANVARLHLAALFQYGPSPVKRWMQLHHEVYWLSYQPANHFWILQAAVGLVLLAMTLICGLATMRCIRGPDQ